MKKMNTLTVNGNAYAVEDAGAVSFAQAQTLTQEQKAQARQNLGIPEEKTYELIEDVTLEEDAASFRRTAEPDGTAYNFSAVRILVFAPAATGSAQVIFSLSSPKTASMIYHQASGAIATSEKRSVLVARNDGGMVDYIAGVGSGSGVATLGFRPRYLVDPWENVSSINLSTYPSTALIPAGTQIQIYAIRG